MIFASKLSWLLTVLRNGEKSAGGTDKNLEENLQELHCPQARLVQDNRTETRGVAGMSAAAGSACAIVVLLINGVNLLDLS